MPVVSAPRAHAPCKEHTGVHDGSPQDGNCGVLRLQLILLQAREADGEVLPLVEHCGEAEVRWALTQHWVATAGRTTHLSPGDGWTARRR